MIGGQRDRVRVRWQAGTPVLFPRPNANIDPYVVTRLLVNTCCTALEKVRFAVSTVSVHGQSHAASIWELPVR